MQTLYHGLQGPTWPGSCLFLLPCLKQPSPQAILATSVFSRQLSMHQACSYLMAFAPASLRPGVLFPQIIPGCLLLIIWITAQLLPPWFPYHPHPIAWSQHPVVWPPKHVSLSEIILMICLLCHYLFPITRTYISHGQSLLCLVYPWILGTQKRA